MVVSSDKLKVVVVIVVADVAEEEDADVGESLWV